MKRYDIYVDDKKLTSYLDRDTAIQFCKDNAANNVELLKKNFYYPFLKEKYKVENIKDIPTEIRYAFWEQENKKYLKEHFKIKIVDITPSPEEVAAFHERYEKHIKQKKKKR